MLRVFVVFSMFFVLLSRPDLAKSQLAFEPDEPHKVIQGSNEMALRLLQKVGTRDEAGAPRNVFFSPTSITMALGMVFLGSRGNTASEIANVFGWTVDDFEEVHLTLKSLHEALHHTNEQHGEFRLANRLWGHNGFELLEEFSQGTQSFYRSEMAQADFINHSERTREEINRWVHEHTGGNIKDLFPKGVITALTKLVLVNAVYFKGVWQNEFDEGKTFHAPFFVHHEQHEQELEVEMMTCTMKQKYYHDLENHCKILELPYSRSDLAMVLILPDQHEGISELEKGLDTEKLLAWLALLRNTTVHISIPKFHMSQEFELKSVLSELGLAGLFDAQQADFSGISSASGLFISSMLHKAHVHVTEQGTEAAAATGITMMKRSIEMNEEFIADHPFLFIIHHLHSKAILFLGKVVQPSQVGESLRKESFKPLSDEL